MKRLQALILTLIIGFSCFGCTLEESIENEGELLIEYIDVGQGDSSLLISPSGKTMLIDTGKPKAYPAIEKVLNERNITKIDVLVITHPHDDHIGSAPKVLSNYEVGRIYINGKAKIKAYQEVKKLSDKASIERKSLLAGDELNWDKSVKIKVFSPFKEGVLGGLNNESPIFKVSYNTHSFLFTGDAEKEAEDTALAYDIIGLKSDVIKVGHHGSHTSSIPDFVLAVKPKLAIISVGKDNSYGHPNKTVVKRWQKVGAEVYSTEKNGNITISTHGKELWLVTEKSNEALAS